MKVPLARIAYGVALFAVLGYAFVTLRGPHGLPGLLEKQQLIHEMERENQKLNQEIERMQDHIRRLDSDPGEQELEIRQRLKLLKPGEKVYITGEPAKK
jgi:cell division protein FtsB